MSANRLNDPARFTFAMRAVISCLVICFAAGCGHTSLPTAEDLVTRSWQVWQGNWHAVWQIEWSGAPVRGPLVAEVWHTGDGRLRIETLEAPVPALSGLVLVHDGQESRLYSMREDRVETGKPGERLRLPLISDALDAVDWLFEGIEGAATVVAGRERLESGAAIRLKITLANSDRADLWIDEATGLPARLWLRSATWGEATFTARSLSWLEQPHPDLFVAGSHSQYLTPSHPTQLLLVAGGTL
jgi:hypothetical protein